MATATAKGGMGAWIQEHPTAAIAGGLVLALVVGSYVLSHKSNPATSQNGPTTNGDLSGLQNGNLVYVPTQTSFSTVNNQQGATFTTTNTTTSISQTGSGNVVNPPTQRPPVGFPPQKPPVGVLPPVRKPPPQKPPVGVLPPVRKPPPPQPQPKPTTKKLIWDQRYTIRGGETLTSIAASLTRSLRAAGMPGSQSVGWHDLYAHNTAVINQQAAAHHNPIPGGPWNDIFPGEQITTPRWG